MTAAIAVRDQTRDDLQALAKKAEESQFEVEAVLSDVIDALLSLSDEKFLEDEVLEEIVRVATEN